MELKIGTLLTLEPTYTERVEKFRCRVVELKDQFVYIDYPINVATNKTAFLVDGAQFRATFTNEAKQSFVFNTEVVGRRGGNVPMMLLSCPAPEDFIKIQRREYVRVETPVDIAVEHNGQFYQFVAEDISAGGTAIIVRNAVGFGDDTNVKLTVVLPFSSGEIRYVQTAARIVRLFDRDEIRIATVQFTDTDDIDKQHIVRFCFERQLMIRKKEMNDF